MRNGWLHTGDYGCFDEEGFLTLKDRSKDLIISGGTNIYPREVEEVLIKHPDVSEVAVIGRPDREWGEVVVAYVVTSTDEKIDEKSFDDFCIDNFARFKRPQVLSYGGQSTQEQQRQGAEDKTTGNGAGV